MPGEPGSSVRWLSAGEQTVWRSLLQAVQLVEAEVSAELHAESGLSHADYELLVRLSEEPAHTLRMSELAARTLFSRSRLSHAVARLEREGWVRREPCPDDKRGHLAILTDRGLAVLTGAAPGHVETVRRAVLDPLNPEQVAQLGDIARTIIAAAHQRAGEPAEPSG